MAWIEWLGNVLLFALVFCMSATVDINCMKVQIRNRNAILTGCFLQFAMLPFLGFAVVNALNLDYAMGISLLVVTSSPGGSYSNWWCSLLNADLALSVTMTAVSTVLSIFFLPFNLLIYARLSYDDDVVQNLDWKGLFGSLSVVIAAITLGLVCSAKVHSHKFNMMSNRVGNYAGIALIIFSATLTNSGAEDTKIWNRSWDFYVGVSLPCLLGLLFSNILSTCVGLKKPERITVSVECCYQNVGIATSMALTMFDGDDLSTAIGVPFFYGIVEGVVVGIYCFGAWKAGWSKAPADAPFWHVIFTSYEVLEAERLELEAVEISIAECDTVEESSNHDGSTLTTYFQWPAESREPKESSGEKDIVEEKTEPPMV